MSQNPKESKTAGLWLRQTREAKNISLEEASRVTHIHPNVLKAIESDDIKGLGDVYARSFLRIYSEFLGLKKDEVLALWSPASPAPVVRRPAASSTRLEPPKIPTPPGEESFDILAFLKSIPWKPVAIAASVILVVFLLARLPGCHKKAASPPKKVAQLSSQAKTKAKAKAAVAPSTQKTSKDKQAAAPKAVVAPAAPKPAVAAPVAAESKTTPTPAPKKSQEKIILVIKAKEKVWLQIKVDGKVAFQSMLAKGSAESWQADEKIEMWVGNAGAIQVELNGQLLGKIGRPGQTLKHVVFTRSGLSIQH